MKGIRRYSVPVRCVLTFVCFLCAVSVLATGSDEATIIGTVYAKDWDNKGNVIAAVLSGAGEECQIVDNAVGRQLFELDKKTVKATGVVAEDSKGNKSFTVTSYEVILR